MSELTTEERLDRIDRALAEIESHAALYSFGWNRPTLLEIAAEVRKVTR